MGARRSGRGSEGEGEGDEGGRGEGLGEGRLGKWDAKEGVKAWMPARGVDEGRAKRG